MKAENVFGHGMFDLEIEQKEHERVNGKKLESDSILRGPMPAGESGDLFPRAAKRGNAEKNPGKTDKMEDEEAARQTTEKSWRLREVTLTREKALNSKADTVDAYPDDESPIGAMPQAAKKHGQHQIDVGAHLAEAIAAQADVKVVAKPSTEADVPAAPEVLQTLCKVRLAKVNHEMETHELGAAAGDAAVAAEITVNLPGKSVGPKQDDEGIRRAEMAAKSIIAEKRTIVPAQDFAKKTHA